MFKIVRIICSQSYQTLPKTKVNQLGEKKTVSSNKAILSKKLTNIRVLKGRK